MHVFKVACQNDTEPFRKWRGLKLQPASLVRPVTLESRVSKGLCLREARDLKYLELPSIDVDNSKFRQRSRMGHLLQSTLCRFTVSLEQGTRRKRSGLAVSSQCLVGGTLRDWPDRKATRVAGSSSPHYERRFRASERLFPMSTSRIPNHGHEHAMGKQDCYTLVPDKFFPGPSWTAVAA